MTERHTTRTLKNAVLAQVHLKNMVWMLAVLLALSSQLDAGCILPDNGLGTADLPVPCPYYTPNDDMRIIDGLPAGTTMEFDAILSGMTGVEIPLGVYSGGNSQSYSGVLSIPLIGTGSLAGFTRPGLAMTVAGSTTSSSRSPYMATQSFDTDMLQLQGQITGDPDFDLLRITAGTSFGMPSPGHTTLTQVAGGNWAVDSFFDITYRIDFVGKPGGHLGGMSGSTTGTIRIQTEPVPEPSTIVLMIFGGLGVVFWATRRVRRNDTPHS